MGICTFRDPEYVEGSPEGTGTYSYEVSENGITITSYRGNERCVSIPEKIEGMPVTAIGPGAFTVTVGDDYLRIEKVFIPDSVRTIGENAFRTSEAGIEKLPDSLERAEENSFAPSAFPAVLRIPDGLKNPRDAVIWESTVERFEAGDGSGYCRTVCGMLLSKDGKRLLKVPSRTAESSVTVPEGVETVGGYAFYGCAGVREIILPGTALKIEPGAFRGMPGLWEIKTEAAVPVYSEKYMDTAAVMRAVHRGNVPPDLIDPARRRDAAVSFCHRGHESAAPETAERYREYILDFFEGFLSAAEKDRKLCLYILRHFSVPPDARQTFLSAYGGDLETAAAVLENRNI